MTAVVLLVWCAVKLKRRMENEKEKKKLRKTRNTNKKIENAKLYLTYTEYISKTAAHSYGP